MNKSILDTLNNKYFRTFVPTLSSMALGILGNMVFSMDKSTKSFPFVVFAFVISIIIEIALVLFKLLKEEEINEVICESEESIKSTMKKVIKTQGKICIMSRDLSWVDPEIELCITSKASSMLIFAEKSTELTERLNKNGVEIKYYGKWNFEPKTRFTIIRYNTRNEQVVIANTQNSINKKGKIKHTIYQTKKGNKTDEWINSLAMDMIDLCKTVSYGEEDE